MLEFRFLRLMAHLTPATLAFLRARVQSALQIEILLLLAQDESRWWSARQLGEELAVAEEPVSYGLEALAAGNMLDVRIGGTLSYRFSPVDTAARRAIEEAVSRPRHARKAVVTSGAREPD